MPTPPICLARPADRSDSARPSPGPSQQALAPGAVQPPVQKAREARHAGEWKVDPDEIECTAIRAQGAGGQNVNKVSSAIHLRFSITASSLPEAIKQRLLALRDHRITDCGTVVIKAQTTRSQEHNRLDAIARLQALIDRVALPPPVRKPTRPTRASQRRRLDGKATRGEVKRLRGPVSGTD